MSKKFFDTILRGTEEARAYMEGARDGYRVTDHEMRKGDFRVQAGGETGQKTASRTPAKEDKRR